MTSLAFVPGYLPATQGLLARFLPPVADGMAAHYIEHYSRPGDLIFDPFGQSPRVAVEALHLGRRVTVANLNPISHLALSLAVRPPAEADLRSALTLLGDMPTGSRADDSQRLEQHVRGLYLTRCADCGTQVSADAFEWEMSADAAVLTHKVLVCPECGGPPKHAVVDEADRALAQRYRRGGPDYHFLLSQVAAPAEPDYEHAQEALLVYPARSLAAIAAVVLKWRVLEPPAEVRRTLSALLVAAFDAVCALGPDRPRILSVPRQFVEHNLWLALEQAIGLLAGTAPAVNVWTLAELLEPAAPPARRAGIHAYHGVARDLAAQLPGRACALFLSAVPRPSQAYWTLSVVWSAWLWGRESAGALRAVLRRRRYDWAWHAEGLERTLSAVRPALAAEGKWIGLVPEAEPGFSAGVLAAADQAGYALEAAALRADTGDAQVVWSLAADAPQEGAAPSAKSLRDAARAAVRDSLAARAEPVRWARAHFAAWTGLAGTRLLARAGQDPLGTVNRALEPLFRDPQELERYGASAEDDLTTGLWYLPVSRAPRAVPLSDRVEAEVLKQLVSGRPVEEDAVMRLVCAAFPGEQTPGRGLALACLASYGQRVAGEKWQLRPEDAADRRAQEVEAILADLVALAARLGFDVSGGNPLVWTTDGGAEYEFAVLATAQVSAHFLLAQAPAPGGSARPWRLLVLPGGRAGLAEYKLRRDPRLRSAMQAGNWQFVKYRHLRQLMADGQLSRANLDSALSGDPVEASRQLSLFTESQSHE